MTLTLSETRFLKPVGTSTAPARIGPFDMSEFYQTKLYQAGGLLVESSFKRYLLDVNASPTVSSASSRPYAAWLLKTSVYDRDIRKELPRMHLSTIEDIACFIALQPNGESGFLVNNGSANIFYVEGVSGEIFAVRVYCHPDNLEWLIGAWKLDANFYQNVGHQVLCPTPVAC